MNTYKLRAECAHDVNLLIQLIIRKDTRDDYAFTIKPMVHMGIPFPDCTLEFSSPLTIRVLVNLMKTIPDSHVMIETIALEKDYTGERITK